MSNRDEEIEKAAEELSYAEDRFYRATNYYEYAQSMPETCECSLSEWGHYVPDICDQYIDDPHAEGHCKNCEHLRECHR